MGQAQTGSQWGKVLHISSIIHQQLFISCTASEHYYNTSLTETEVVYFTAQTARIPFNCRKHADGNVFIL